jgi:PAS domain-containing protein
LTLRARFLLYLFLVHALLVVVGAALVTGSRLASPSRPCSWSASWARSCGARSRRSRFSGRHAAPRRDDFHIRTTGLDETDALVSVYNRMADSLREERTKQEEKHHFLARILSASPSGILTLDFDGRVDFANPAAEKLLGAGAKELLALKLNETASPLARSLAELPENGTDLLAAGEGRRLRVHRGTFYDRGFPRAFFLVEELTEELRRYEKSAYERVIRMMSHEVNNSVGAARSLLASAAHYEKHLPEPDRADLAQALSVASARLGQLNTFMRLRRRREAPAPNLGPLPSRRSWNLRRS